MTDTIEITETDAPFVPDRDSKYPRYLLDMSRTDLTLREVQDFIRWYESRHPNWQIITDHDRRPGWLMAVRRDLLCRYL